MGQHYRLQSGDPTSRMTATSPAHPPSQARPRRHVESWCRPADHSCPYHCEPPQSCRNQPRDGTKSLIHGFRVSPHHRGGKRCHWGLRNPHSSLSLPARLGVEEPIHPSREARHRLWEGSDTGVKQLLGSDTKRRTPAPTFGLRAGLWRSESRNPAREEGHAAVRASTRSVPVLPADRPPRGRNGRQTGGERSLCVI